MLKKIGLTFNFPFIFKVSGSIALLFFLFILPLQYFIKFVLVIAAVMYLRRNGFYG